MLKPSEETPDIWGGFDTKTDEFCPKCQEELVRQGFLYWCSDCEQGYKQISNR